MFIKSVSFSLPALENLGKATGADPILPGVDRKMSQDTQQLPPWGRRSTAVNLPAGWSPGHGTGSLTALQAAQAQGLNSHSTGKTYISAGGNHLSITGVKKSQITPATRPCKKLRRRVLEVKLGRRHRPSNCCSQAHVFLLTTFQKTAELFIECSHENLQFQKFCCCRVR